jgi:hypothetical protein
MLELYELSRVLLLPRTFGKELCLGDRAHTFLMNDNTSRCERSYLSP